MSTLKAPLVRRFVGLLIDLMVFALLSLFFPAGYFILSSADGLSGRLISFVLILIGMVCAGGFMLLRDSMGGGYGFGKRRVGLRVVRSDGSRCDMLSSAVRNATMLVPVLNVIELFVGALDKDGLRLGDRLAGTQVVE